jgi:polyhydroxyalkanoate synthase subunit PhaC
LPRRNPPRLDGGIFGRERDDRIASATYFTTLVDFTEVGDMAVFIDEGQLASLERRMRERGYLEAQDMAVAFSMLRANDHLVLRRQQLPARQGAIPVDLLFWNSDSTRMPAAMHSFYLRKMYQKNLLAKPGGITLADAPIDLSKIRTPTFILATREDHIAPWKSTYAATRLYSGPIKFVLTDGWRDQPTGQQIWPLDERQLTAEP